jgi:hypothetical protein
VAPIASHARGAHASSQRPSLHSATTSIAHSVIGHGTFEHARTTGLVRGTANVGHSQHVGAAGTQSSSRPQACAGAPGQSAESS